MSFFKMEPLAYVADRFKDFKKSSESFVKGKIWRHSENSSHQSPIEMLKRLQREVFSDLMKLRDRQEKVEHILSFYKSSGGSPFQEASTHMRGIVDVAGALMFIDGDYQQACDRFDKTGRGVGINSKFIFETFVKQKDALTAEFVTTSQNSRGYLGHVLGSPLVLEKVKYLAHVNDQLSVISVPLGARCNDFEIDSILPKELSPFGPPLFNQWHDYAAGLVAKGSKLATSFAGLLSNMGTAIDAADTRIHMSTFGQLRYHLSEETRFNLSGLWQISRRGSHPMKLGPLAIPLGSSRQTTGSEAQGVASHSSIPIEATDYSYAVMLESIFDESTKLKAWIEVQNSSAGSVHLGISLSDTPKDELGWGFRAARKVDGDFSQSHLEGFLNFNLGKRCNFQPGLVYAMDGNGRTYALFFRSSWFM